MLNIFEIANHYVKLPFQKTALLFSNNQQSWCTNIRKKHVLKKTLIHRQVQMISPCVQFDIYSSFLKLCFKTNKYWCTWKYWEL